MNTFPCLVLHVGELSIFKSEKGSMFILVSWAAVLSSLTCHRHARYESKNIVLIRPVPSKGQKQVGKISANSAIYTTVACL